MGGEKVNLLSAFEFEASRTASYKKHCEDMFSWLSWTPATSHPCNETLAKCFPGVVPGQVVVQRASAALKRHGLEPGNTIYGQSICPDEINNEKGDLAPLMSEYWGNCFPMGGLGGAPFVGKTGFNAFSHHVPQDGHVVILFGPHIAVSETGELGKYLREGQCNHSCACGAVLAAYDAVKSNKVGKFDTCDMQQCWLKDQISKKLDSITNTTGDGGPINALIHVAYESVKEKLLTIVNNDFGKGKLVLIGGIQINMPAPFEDHFQPLMFEIWDNDGKKTNLLQELEFRAPRALSQCPVACPRCILPCRKR